MTELLEPHYNGHPITYNHYLTDNVQKAQSDRRQRSLEKTLKEFFTFDSIEERYRYDFVPATFLTFLKQSTKDDMERYASNLAVDYMQAYYKVNSRRSSAYTAWERVLESFRPSSFVDADMTYRLL